MLKTLKLLAILLTLLLLVLVFYGIFKGIFDYLLFWGIYLLLVAADLLCIAIIKKYNEQEEC